MDLPKLILIINDIEIKDKCLSLNIYNQITTE
jgi:hypothetical protein